MASCRSAFRRSFSEKFSDNFTSFERNYISLLPKEIRDELFRYSTSCNYRLKLYEDKLGDCGYVELMILTCDTSIILGFDIGYMRNRNIRVDRFINKIEAVYGLDLNFDTEYCIEMSSVIEFGLDHRYRVMSHQFMDSNPHLYACLDGVHKVGMFKISSELIDILWHIHDLVSEKNK